VTFDNLAIYYRASEWNIVLRLKVKGKKCQNCHKGSRQCNTSQGRPITCNLSIPYLPFSREDFDNVVNQSLHRFSHTPEQKHKRNEKNNLRLLQQAKKNKEKEYKSKLPNRWWFTTCLPHDQVTQKFLMNSVKARIRLLFLETLTHSKLLFGSRVVFQNSTCIWLSVEKCFHNCLCTRKEIQYSLNHMAWTVHIVRICS